MTFSSYFQTFYVLRKCKLKGKEPIKVSLADYTQDKFKITFKRQLTGIPAAGVFLRMSSKETSKETGDELDTPTSVQSADSKPASPRLSSTYGKMGKLYFSIINEESGFSLFCLHLTKQWSIENMVGFIEFAQLFRALLPYKPPDLDIELGLLEDYRFENVEELPKSDIVFNHEKYKTLSSKIISLYAKYVSPTCKFQINLSSRVRYQWINEVMKLQVPVVEKPSFGRRFTDSFNKHKRKGSNSKLKKPSSVPITPTEIEHASQTDVLHEDIELGPLGPATLISKMSSKESGGKTPVDSHSPDPSQSLEKSPQKANDGPDENGTVIVMTTSSTDEENDEENGDDGELVTQESLNKYMSMDIKAIQEEEKKKKEKEDTLPGVEIDVDVGKFLVLIQRILEQCHLLLMDSYSRFKTERNRQIEYDMHDHRVVKHHSVRNVKQT